MSIIQWNLRGFAGNREQVRVLFKEHNASAICLQETKLGNQSPNVGSNFIFYRSPPLVGARAQGGTGIMVHKSVNHRLVQLNTILQAYAVQIFTSKWITLCSVYLDPNLEDRLQDVHGSRRQLAFTKFDRPASLPIYFNGRFQFETYTMGRFKLWPMGILHRRAYR